MIPSITKYLLSYALLIISAAHAADTDTDQYYVRFVKEMTDKEGMLTTFPKAVLKDIKLLDDMALDLPGSGTADSPFPLLIDHISPDDFDAVVKLIEQIPNFVVRSNVAAIEPFIWNNLPSDRYTQLARLLRAGDYLSINPTIAATLKLSITKASREKKISGGIGMIVIETLDDALKAGLKDINKLPQEPLLSIKKAILYNINLKLENFITKNINNHSYQHPKQVFPLPENLKNNVTFVDISEIAYNYIVRSNQFSNTLLRLSLKNTPTGLDIFNTFKAPQFNFFSEIPNQHLLPHKIRHLDLKKLRAANLNNQITFCKLSPTYLAVSATYTIEINDSRIDIGNSYIWHRKAKQPITFPASIREIGSFKDSTGREKLASLMGWSSMGIIDPITQQYIAIEIPEATDLTGVFESMYFICYRNDETEGTKLRIIDLNTHNTIMDIVLDDNKRYDDDNAKLLFSHLDNTTLMLFITENDVLHEYYGLDTYIINTQTQIFQTQDQLEIEHPFVMKIIEDLPSKKFIADTNHPDLKNLLGTELFEHNSELFAMGFDETNKSFVKVVYWTSQEINHFKKIKQLTHLSIEQLYVLEEMMHRYTSGIRNVLTPTEKQIFESMPLQDQNLFHEIFSAQGKPFTDPTGRQFIVSPAKTGEYETPLSKYIEQKPATGKKRPAQEETEIQRPTKKQRVADDSDEESSSDESTLDESEDNG